MQHIENPGIVRTVYSDIFKDIKQYSAMFRHIEGHKGIFRHYWGIWSHNHILSNPCIYNCATFRTLAYLEPEASSKYVQHVRWSSYSESWHSHNSLFKHFQGYLGIFSSINAYSATLTGVQLAESGEASLTLFENRKGCTDFGKKGPDCVHLWVKFPIQNLVLRVSRRKNSKMFPCGTSFFVFDKMFM